MPPELSPFESALCELACDESKLTAPAAQDRDLLHFEKFLRGIIRRKKWRRGQKKGRREESESEAFMHLCTSAGFRRTRNGECWDVPWKRGNAKRAEAALASLVNAGFAGIPLTKRDIKTVQRFPFNLQDKPLPPTPFTLKTCVFDRNAVCSRVSKMRPSSVPRYLGYTDTFKNYPAVAWIGSEKESGSPVDETLAELFPPIAHAEKLLLL